MQVRDLLGIGVCLNNLGDQRNQDKPTTAPSSHVEPDGTQRQPNQAVNAAQLRAWALAAGFSEAGVVALPLADEERNAARVEQWIQSGRAGSMRYLERRDEAEQLLRARVSVPFPWARSVVVCFASYHADQPRSTDAAATDKGWIARYAWSGRVDPQLGKRPSDYHKVLLKRLKTLEARVRQELSGTYNADFTARAFVDTGPVVERSLAVAAGLGWTGKNTCLIHPKLGSYGFLAVLLTSLDVDEFVSPGNSDSVVSHPFHDRTVEWMGHPTLKASTAQIPDRCGSCTRCIEACPTGALVAPYQMDATRCIAYLTIEHKGPIDEELMAGMGRQVFGCDICQDVCPWNRKAPITTDPELEARPELVNPALEALAAMDEAEFERLFNGSPVRRAGWNSLRRNIAIAMGNSGLARWNPALDLWKDAADEGLHLAARWALKRFEKNSLRG
jgi:epoxyqueuosine reductase